jgi:hypothetical protein
VSGFIHTGIEATFRCNSTSVFQFLLSRLSNNELDYTEMGLHLNPLATLHSTRLALEGGLPYMTNRIITFFLNDGDKASLEMLVFSSEVMRLVV